jgi:hypothetical protein
MGSRQLLMQTKGSRATYPGRDVDVPDFDPGDEVDPPGPAPLAPTGFVVRAFYVTAGSSTLGTVELDCAPNSESLVSYEWWWSLVAPASADEEDWQYAGESLVLASPPAGYSASELTWTTAPLATPLYFRVNAKGAGQVRGAFAYISSPTTIPPAGGVADLPSGYDWDELWHGLSDDVNALIVPSPAVYSGSATVINTVFDGANPNGGVTYAVYADVPPCFGPPEVPDNVPYPDGEVNGWRWYRVSCPDQLGAQSGQLRVLWHRNMGLTRAGVDNPALVAMRNHPNVAGVAYEYIYVRLWAMGGYNGSGTGVDHSARLITADGCGVFRYGPGTANLGPILGRGVGWNIGWRSLIRRIDFANGYIPHSIGGSQKFGWAGSGNRSKADNLRDFWLPAKSTDQDGSGGPVYMGMCFQWPAGSDQAIWNRTVLNGGSYDQYYDLNGNLSTASQPGVNGPRPGRWKSTTGASVYSEVAWPINGGPPLTYREMLWITLRAFWTHGYLLHDGGGSGFMVDIEHDLSARWQGGVTPDGRTLSRLLPAEHPAGGGWSNVLRGVGSGRGTPRATDGLPLYSMRILQASKTSLPYKV